MTRQQDTHNIPGERLLRIGEVLAMTGIGSRQTIWRLVRKGEFPKPIHPLGHSKFIAWVHSEVQAWIIDRAKREAAWTNLSRSPLRNIKAKNKIELRAMLVEQYGEETTKQIWDTWNAPRLIEGAVSPDIDQQEPINVGDIGLHGELVEPTKCAVEGDSPTARAPIANMERHAMQSLANSKAPKLK